MQYQNNQYYRLYPDSQLVEYIREQRSRITRYELDGILLRQGYVAAEVEAAWQVLAQQDSGYIPRRSRPNRQWRRSYGPQNLGWLAMSAGSLLIVMFVLALLVFLTMGGHAVTYSYHYHSSLW